MLHMYSPHLPLSAQWLESKALCNSDGAICETLVVQSYVKFLTKLIPRLPSEVLHVTMPEQWGGLGSGRCITLGFYPGNGSF